MNHIEMLVRSGWVPTLMNSFMMHTFIKYPDHKLPMKHSNIALGFSRISRLEKRAFGIIRLSGRGGSKTAIPCPFIEIDDVSSDGWKLAPAIDLLKEVRHCFDNHVTQ